MNTDMAILPPDLMSDSAPSAAAPSEPPSIREQLVIALSAARREPSVRILQAQLAEKLMERATASDDGLLLAAALQLQYSSDSQWCTDLHAVADVVTSSPAERVQFFTDCGMLMPQRPIVAPPVISGAAVATPATDPAPPLVADVAV